MGKIARCGRLVAALGLFLPACFLDLLLAQAQVIHSQDYALRVAKVVEGLEHPWGLAFLPDGRKLLTERPGRLRIVGKDGKLEAQSVAGVPAVAAVGQGGLLDVALHPRFSENQASRNTFLSLAQV